MPRVARQRLKRRRDGRYRCTYHGIQFMGNTEEEALAKREEYKRSQRTAAFRKGNQTLGEYAVYWLPVHKAGVKTITYNAYASILTRLISPIRDTPLHSLTTDHLSEMYAALAGMSESYIHKARILITQLLDSAVDAGLMPKNPARAKSVRPPKGTSGTHRAISQEERQAILSTPHRVQLAALVMLYCGLRRGEVLALRVSDFGKDSVTVRRAVTFAGNKPEVSTPKTDAGKRTVPVPDFIMRMLPESGYILPGANGPVTETAFQCAWRSYTKALGFDIRPHDLRHSYCTWLRDSGVDMHQAIIWMGHADEKMILNIYDHPGAERESIAKKRLFSSL